MQMKKNKFRQKYPYFINIKDDSGTTLLRTNSKARFAYASYSYHPQNYHLRVLYPKAKGYIGQPVNEAECKNKTELQKYVLLFTEDELLRTIYA